MGPPKFTRQGEFERERTRSDGRHKLRFVIRCAECSAVDNYTPGSGTMMPNDKIAYRFSTRGWFTEDGRRDRDLCPLHNRHRKNGTKEPAVKHEPPKDGEGPPNITPIGPASEPPREMSYEDRRLIFAKLHEVYLDEKKGYSAGWSDNRVAVDLGVPRAWVTKIRGENFGPDGGNEEVHGLIVEAKALLSETENRLTAVGVLSEEAKAIARALSALTPRLTEIEKVHRDLDDKARRLTKIGERIAKACGL